MRFAPSFALFSALFSLVTAHAIAHRSRTLSERQYRQTRPRADLLNTCVSVNLAALFPLGISTGVDFCFCFKDLNTFLTTGIAVKLAGLLGSNVDLAVVIKDQSTQCGDLPAHAHRVCSNANPCHFSCDSGYVEQNGICVCAAPTKDCNGKCAFSCASALPRSPEPRLITAGPQKRTVPTFQGSVFAPVAKRPLHIDTCDLFSILALSDIARVQVDLPILNSLLQALKLGGCPATCPSTDRDTHINLDLCELFEGLSLGSIKVKADVNLGELNGLLNELLGLLRLGGQKLSCRHFKSSEAVSCALSQRSLVARTLDVDLCPLLESLGLGDTLKVKVDIDGLGPVLDQLLNGLLAALGAGGFPPCGAKTFSSLARPTSDSSDIVSVVDPLVDSLVAMKSLLTSLGCGCSGGSDLSNALEALVVLVNQILTALGNVTDDLGKYISSSQHLLAELQCSLKSYSSMDALPKDTSATVDKLVSACDVLLTVLDKTLADLDSCGCKEDQQTVQNVKKHIADNPFITPTPRINPSDVSPTHDRPAEQGPDSEPCEYADDDLVTALLQSLGLDDLLGTSNRFSLISTQGTQCGDLPAHAHRVCSNANPCHFSCDSGYVEQNGICVCAAPTKDCNGKCAYSCASSVSRSPEPRLITAGPQKRTVPTFQGSVFAPVAKRPLHIDTCDLFSILALSDIARVQVDLPILNSLLQALKLGGRPATCPSTDRDTHINLDLCELLEGLSLGSIQVKANVNLGPELNGLLDGFLGLLHLGGQKLSCRQSKSSKLPHSLVARTTDIESSPHTGVLTSSGCECSDGSDTLEDMKKLVFILNNVTNTLEKAISSVQQHPSRWTNAVHVGTVFTLAGGMRLCCEFVILLITLLCAWGLQLLYYRWRASRSKDNENKAVVACYEEHRKLPQAQRGNPFDADEIRAFGKAVDNDEIDLSNSLSRTLVKAWKYTRRQQQTPWFLSFYDKTYRLIVELAKAHHIWPRAPVGTGAPAGTGDGTGNEAANKAEKPAGGEVDDKDEDGNRASEPEASTSSTVKAASPKLRDRRRNSNSVKLVKARHIGPRAPAGTGNEAADKTEEKPASPTSVVVDDEDEEGDWESEPEASTSSTVNAASRKLGGAKARRRNSNFVKRGFSGPPRVPSGEQRGRRIDELRVDGLSRDVPPARSVRFMDDETQSRHGSGANTPRVHVESPVWAASDPGRVTFDLPGEGSGK